MGSDPPFSHPDHPRHPRRSLMNSLFHMSNLEFGYSSSLVLRGLSTEIAAGEFVGLIGPNGAGKSTLLKIMAGLLRGYHGSVDFSGKSLSQWNSRDLAKRVAFVPQETHMVFPFTASEIVMMGRLPHRAGPVFDSPRDVDLTFEAMALTDTASLASKIFNQLSGGERQRVVLASALAQNPDVLLLDEPTVYLDLKHQMQFYDILERLNAERRMTIISVTHDVNLAARYARRMIAVRSGVFFADGSPEEVLTPHHLYDIFEITATIVQRPDGRGRYIIPTA
jgi:cobalamin transport system ATP-binding protein